MNSCRHSLQIWPVRVRNWIAANHSSCGRLDFLDGLVQLADDDLHHLPSAAHRWPFLLRADDDLGRVRFGEKAVFVCVAWE